MSKPTPTPWALEKEFERRFHSVTGELTQMWKYWIRPADQQFEFIAYVPHSSGQGEANSAFILKCVNSHAALTEAIDAALGEFKDIECGCDVDYVDGEPVGYPCYFHRVEDRLRRALAKAREGGDK